MSRLSPGFPRYLAQCAEPHQTQVLITLRREDREGETMRISALYAGNITTMFIGTGEPGSSRYTRLIWYQKPNQYGDGSLPLKRRNFLMATCEAKDGNAGCAGEVVGYRNDDDGLARCVCLKHGQAHLVAWVREATTMDLECEVCGSTFTVVTLVPTEFIKVWKGMAGCPVCGDKKFASNLVEIN